jgi:hypothetical protein
MYWKNLKRTPICTLVNLNICMCVVNSVATLRVAWVVWIVGLHSNGSLTVFPLFVIVVLYHRSVQSAIVF